MRKALPNDRSARTSLHDNTDTHKHARINATARCTHRLRMRARGSYSVHHKDAAILVEEKLRQKHHERNSPLMQRTRCHRAHGERARTVTSARHNESFLTNVGDQSTDATSGSSTSQHRLRPPAGQSDYQQHRRAVTPRGRPPRTGRCRSAARRSCARRSSDRRARPPPR